MKIFAYNFLRSCSNISSHHVLTLFELEFSIIFDIFKVVRDPCQKITLLLLKSKSVRVIVPESCF